MILHRCITVENGNRCVGAWHDSARFTEGLCAVEYPCHFAMAIPGEGTPPITIAYRGWLIDKFDKRQVKWNSGETSP